MKPNGDEEVAIIARAQGDVNRYGDVSGFVVASLTIVTWDNMLPYPCSIFESNYHVTKVF